MDAEYAQLARRRAGLLERCQRIEKERLHLRVELEKLDGRLSQMARMESWATATAVPCGSGCTIAALHSHFADGEVMQWAAS